MFEDAIVRLRWFIWSLLVRATTALKGFVLWLKVGYPFVLLLATILIIASLKHRSISELWLLGTIGAAFIVAEMINYSIERICNLIDSKPNENIRVIKDVSAGAVWVAGMVLIIMGIYTILR